MPGNYKAAVIKRRDLWMPLVAAGGGIDQEVTDINGRRLNRTAAAVSRRVNLGKDIMARTTAMVAAIIVPGNNEAIAMGGNLRGIHGIASEAVDHEIITQRLTGNIVTLAADIGAIAILPGHYEAAVAQRCH